MKTDQKHYRADDAARTQELAGAMIQKLSAAMTPKARAAYDRYVRIWTLLAQRYDEVRAGVHPSGCASEPLRKLRSSGATIELW